MYFEIHGDNHPDTVLLSSGLGGSHHYWDSLIPELATRFRVVVYDQYGTGNSDGAIGEGYSVTDMAHEVNALLSTTKTQQVHFIGHALGGLIGLQLALDAPHKVASLLLINSWEKTDDHTRLCFEIRKRLLHESGVEMFVKAQPLFLYPAQWIKQHAALLSEEAQKMAAAFADTSNLLRRITAIEQFDLSGQLHNIRCPTGIIASRDDLLVPYSCSEQLNQAIPDSYLYFMPYGGHACNITEPEEFRQILDHFYS